MSTFCPYYDEKKCSSCRLITVPYAEQLQIKEKKLTSFLGISPLKTISSQEKNFRAKAKMVVSGTIDSPVIGIADQEILDCPIHHPELNQLMKKIKKFISRAKIAPYQIETRIGELKFLILFYSPKSDRFYLRFVLRSKEAETRIKKFLPELLAEEPRLEVVSLNLQPIPHALIEGEEEIFLTQKETLTHEIGPFRFELSPQGFVQTNSDISEKLYQTAASWVSELQTQRFLELYSGQGFFSFFAATHISQGLGIEINPKASVAATHFAKELNLLHLSFESMDAKDVDEKAKAFHPDLILVNPPRAGLKESVPLLLSLKAPYLIYSSCDSETLAQDCQNLSSQYEIIRTQIFDMFPQTEHFETLVLLKLR